VRINKFAYSGAAVAAATAVIVAIGALAGCSAGATAAAGGQAESTVVTVDSVPASEEGGLYVADYEGFFAQQGITVKIKPITGGEAGIPDLQSGKADLVAGNYVSFILAQMAGKFDGKPANMRIIAAGSELQPGSEALYVMPRSTFKTVADLGKYHARVGLNTPNDVGDVMVGALLEDTGYTLKDVRQVIPAGGFPALLKMLPAGRVDAIWLPQPLGAIAEQQLGAVPLADFDQGSMQNFPFTGYIGTTHWVQSHPATVAAFLRALAAGQELADTDREAVESAMEKYTGIPPLVADNMSIDSYPLTMDLPELQRVPDSMFQYGLTPGAKSAYQIVNMVQPEPGLIRG
jgi:ABC-type nitrate/sulfonate/bicarbonate transport system substrate-binding protein